MALDTIISNDEVIVIGPPASITISTDIGPQGERGAVFFTGIGTPVSETLSNPKLGDLYINREQGPDYGSIYLLSSVPGGSTWIKVLKFSPTFYSTSSSVSFSSGSAQVSFPLSSFYPDAPVDFSAEDVLLQATIELDNPAMLSVNNKQITGTGSSRIFSASLNGAQFSSGSVSALSGSCNANFIVTVGGN